MALPSGMRTLVLVLMLAAPPVSAQIGFGVQIPVGRSTHRLGTVPDSLAIYSLKELDLRPRCLPGTERWVAGLFAADSCTGPPPAAGCGPHGPVVMRFVIERDGSVSGLELVRGGCPALQERMRCAAEGRIAWEPGRIGHRKVRARMQLRAAPPR